MKSSDAKYDGRSANPLAALEKRQYVTSKALVRGLKESLDAIKGKIATAKTPAFAESQRKLFAEISAAYAEIAKTTDKYLKAEVSAAAALGGKAAGKDAGGHDLVRWDEARCRRYWMYVNPQSGKKLAAVFTDKMAESTVIALRRSVVEVQRRAAIEGMSLKDQHKAILESWNALTGDDSNFQFVDKSGKAWDNARYLQMLSRTTVQRVYRDAYADRLAESGYKLVRITSLGAPDCPVCRAWQGVICTIAGTQGNLPTIDQAREAGVWHPNCVCSMEYVDEELDADDIEAQEKTAAVDWEDGDAVQERTDGMAIGKYKAQGMDDAEAEDALTRAKIEEALRTELFLENSEDIANGFSHGQLEEFRKKGIPDFALTKGKQKPGIDGDTIYIDRTHPQESLQDLLGVKAGREETRRKAQIDPKSQNVADAVVSVADSFGGIQTSEIPESVARRDRRLKQAEEILHARAMDANRIFKASGYSDEYAKAFRRYSVAKGNHRRIEESFHREAVPWALRLIAHGGDNAVVNVGSASRLLPRWNEAREVVAKIVSRDVFPAQALNVRKIRGRGFARGADIKLSDTAPVPTFVHEVMHFVERFNPHVHARCVEFLRHRTAGETPQSLKALTGRNYDSDERARPDRFFDPYCGKVYGSDANPTATEILSMGVERLVQNPVRFLREDREYAAFCLGLIRGML